MAASRGASAYIYLLHVQQLLSLRPRRRTGKPPYSTVLEFHHETKTFVEIRSLQILHQTHTHHIQLPTPNPINQSIISYIYVQIVPAIGLHRFPKQGAVTMEQVELLYNAFGSVTHRNPSSLIYSHQARTFSR
jgi:hypothetical protein